MVKGRVCGNICNLVIQAKGRGPEAETIMHGEMWHMGCTVSRLYFAVVRQLLVWTTSVVIIRPRMNLNNRHVTQAMPCQS